MSRPSESSSESKPVGLRRRSVWSVFLPVLPIFGLLMLHLPAWMPVLEGSLLRKLNAGTVLFGQEPAIKAFSSRKSLK